MEKYVKPDLEIVQFSPKDVICTSVENFSSYVDPNPGDWGDIEFPDDPDEWIDW